MQLVLVLALLAAAPDPKPALEVMAKARGFTLDTSLVGGGPVLRPGDQSEPFEARGNHRVVVGR